MQSHQSAFVEVHDLQRASLTVREINHAMLRMFVLVFCGAFGDASPM